MSSIKQCQAYKKCSVCLGPSKVMGKIFCQICAWSTHHKHIAWSPYERGSGQGHFDALWCNLHLYLNLFCVNIIIFCFLVLNIFCGVNFFLGPAVPRSCGFCRPEQCITWFHVAFPLSRHSLLLRVLKKLDSCCKLTADVSSRLSVLVRRKHWMILR